VEYLLLFLIRFLVPNFGVFFCYQFFRRGGLCSTVSWDFVPARWSGVRGPGAFTVGEESVFRA
jgi:hypothetical protein